ncbi:hypothetical protein AB0I68_14095 [Streptomyces sp. NPDC050448]|uniref:hypothetical protein n=1 Tax=Streptomyces sp. NPDC050448 TaxID=3155404 RepID=UPI003426564D
MLALSPTPALLDTALGVDLHHEQARAASVDAVAVQAGHEAQTYHRPRISLEFNDQLFSCPQQICVVPVGFEDSFLELRFSRAGLLRAWTRSSSESSLICWRT